ncbi:MAG TPA: PKD domain-containing protein [Ferruginibacter sp.]|mgnify:CR=1 FL=1|nr:PKD domain-containing protein [Ferruginibacter sp.]HMP20756.1 PKD domain-containing protein [Ferruginibacter sp.]
MKKMLLLLCLKCTLPLLSTAQCPANILVQQNTCAGTATPITDLEFNYYQSAPDDSTLLKQVWDYGDQTSDSFFAGNFKAAHTHTYSTGGNYIVSLTVFLKNGCSTTITVPVAVRHNPFEADSFTYTVSTNCSTPYRVSFNANLPGNIVGTPIVQWNFSNTNAVEASDSVVVWNYSRPGTYRVRLITRASFCTIRDTAIKFITIPPKVNSNFKYAINQENRQVQFTSVATGGVGNPAQWFWDFGDGTTAATANPSHTYNTYGSYIVKHSVVSNYGCVSDTVSRIVHVTPLIISNPALGKSNMGTEFWTGFGFMEYMRQNPQSAGSAHMSLYIAGGATASTVFVDMPALSPELQANAGFPWKIEVPADSVIEITRFPRGDSTDFLNRLNLADSRLYFTGISPRGIHITSTQPVAIWQHIYSTTNTAGATLLLPVNVWGNAYTIQAWGGESNTRLPNSFFFIVAEEDSTAIEFIPTAPIIDSSTATLFTVDHTTANILYPAGVAQTIMLHRGQVFNAMGMVQGPISAAKGLDLSGTKIRTINPSKKIAVFSGNGRVLLNTNGCNNATGSDNLIQQMFPKIAWGTRYLTTPTKSMEYGIYRITVNDASTIVKVNGLPVTTALIQNSYYQIESNKPLLIESDKRIMVTQYIVTPGCPGVASGNSPYGDPEMINLSPLKYAVNNVTVYSPNFKNTITQPLSASFINVVLHKTAVASFRLNNSNMVDTGSSSYSNLPYNNSGPIAVTNAFIPHPGDSNYYYARLKVPTGEIQTLQADSLFTAIAYGMGNGESVGFNVGFNFNVEQIEYKYIGNGNWTDENKWLGNKLPPNPLPLGSVVIILGNCIINTPQTIEDGAKIIVESGANLIINGNLTILY